MPYVSLGHSINDGNSSGSDVSLDEELGIPIMPTPGVKKAMEGMNEKLLGPHVPRILWRG